MKKLNNETAPIQHGGLINMTFIVNLYHEFKIWKLLKKISSQRVAMVLKPHNILVIENCVNLSADDDARIATCLMRGWIDIFENSIPCRNLDKNGEILNKPLEEIFINTGNLYKITESGWAVIYHQRTKTNLIIILTALTVIISFLTFN